MAEIRQDFGIRLFGGLNVADQEDQLSMRSHTQTQAGFSQQNPAESPVMVNIDFTKTGIKKRLGSTLDRSCTASAVASEELLCGTEFVASASGTRYEVIVGTKSIYVAQTGLPFAQITDTAGVGYTHTADVSKCSFAQLDGHLFIGLDDTQNAIQVFRTGTALDAPFTNGNDYIYAYDTSDTTAVYNNIMPNGTWMVESIHNRLCYSKGDVLVYYTQTAYAAASGLWDSAAVDFYSTTSRTQSLNSFAPALDNSLNEVLYIGTADGFDVVEGFQTTDYPYRIRGAKSPLNNRCVAQAKNWLVYLTRDKNIYAINKSTVIDLGRRLKTDSDDGPLDMLEMGQSESSAFGYYSHKKEQAYFYFSSSALNKNNYCVVCDFKLGEPIPGEALTQYEMRVRNLHWELGYGDTTAAEYWFTSVYDADGEEFGVLNDTGATVQEVYTYNSTDDDIDTEAVSAVWRSSVFLANAEEDNKQWMVLTTRAKPKGEHTITVSIYINREAAATDSFTFQQYVTGIATWDTGVWDTSTWGGDQVVKNSHDIDLYSDAIQWAYSNSGETEPFEISNCNMRYLIGAEER